MSRADEVVRAARAWVGRHFNAGQREQCAWFVRQVFAESGIKLPTAHRPADWDLTHDLGQGPGYANSLSGPELGPKVELANLVGGDLLLFRDTYRGDFPVGSITHVAVYVGEGYFVHRPTADAPVAMEPLTAGWKALWFEARRPASLLPPPEPAPKPEAPEKLKVKLFAHAGGLSLVVPAGVVLGPGTHQLDSVQLTAELGRAK